MPRIQLCRLEELETIDSRGFEIDHSSTLHNIFIVRDGNSVTAYQNSCPHNFAPLDWAPDNFLSYEKDYIQCASHGALFEIDSGRCIHGPCVGQALDKVDIEIDDNVIYAIL